MAGRRGAEPAPAGAIFRESRYSQSARLRPCGAGSRRSEASDHRTVLSWRQTVLPVTEEVRPGPLGTSVPAPRSIQAAAALVFALSTRLDKHARADRLYRPSNRQAWERVE